MDFQLPIACSLEGSEARRRWEAWNHLLARRVETEQSDHHIALMFPRTGGTSTELASLVAAERACCGFVTWDLQNRGDFTRLTIHGDIDEVAAMAESFGLEQPTDA